MELADQTLKKFGMGEPSKQTVKLQLAGSISFVQCFDKLTAEDFPKDRLGEEETGIGQVHPAGVVRGQQDLCFFRI